jgi:hypothetical protein
LLRHNLMLTWSCSIPGCSEQIALGPLQPWWDVYFHLVMAHGYPFQRVVTECLCVGCRCPKQGPSGDRCASRSPGHGWHGADIVDHFGRSICSFVTFALSVAMPTLSTILRSVGTSLPAQVEHLQDVGYAWWCFHRRWLWVAMSSWDCVQVLLTQLVILMYIESCLTAAQAVLLDHP